MSKTILSVDDSASVLQMVKLTLSGDVVQANNGAEGLTKAKGGGMDQVGELVIAQSRLRQIAASSPDLQVKAIAEEVECPALELRDTTMGARLVPIGQLFGRFRRLVHDLSRELSKEIDLVLVGEETELDKTLIERLADPLINLIRNAVVEAGARMLGCILDAGGEYHEVGRGRTHSPRHDACIQRQRRHFAGDRQKCGDPLGTVRNNLVQFGKRRGVRTAASGQTFDVIYGSGQVTVDLLQRLGRQPGDMAREPLGQPIEDTYRLLQVLAGGEKLLLSETAGHAKGNRHRVVCTTHAYSCTPPGLTGC
jgi:hypothetical protein